MNAHTGKSNWVLITVAVIGGVVLVGAIATAAVSSIASIARPAASTGGVMTADVTGMKKIKVSASAAEMSVGCDAAAGSNADEAVLSVEDGHQVWSMRFEDETLRVEPERGPLGWLRNWNLFGIGGWQSQKVSLHLPEWACERGAAIDGEFEISSGLLIAEGQYDRLGVQVSAGEARVSGEAHEVDAGVSAGSAELKLTDVAEARFEVSAGSMRSQLEGSAPDQVNIEVSAGELELELPPAVYSVNSDVSAGDLDNRLRTDGGGSARHHIDVDVSAGKVILRSDR